jgi:hypothetical protein
LIRDATRSLSDLILRSLSDLILRSRAPHGVSKDRQESVPGNILRDAGFAGSSG